MRLAVHGIVSFSEKPLRAALWGGMAISVTAASLGAYAVVAWAFNFGVVQGWTSTVVIISFLPGINLFMTGVIGLYVGGIHAEVKRRPLYVVDRRPVSKKPSRRKRKIATLPFRLEYPAKGSVDGRTVRPVSRELQQHGRRL